MCEGRKFDFSTFVESFIRAGFRDIEKCLLPEAERNPAI